VVHGGRNTFAFAGTVRGERVLRGPPRTVRHGHRTLARLRRVAVRRGRGEAGRAALGAAARGQGLFQVPVGSVPVSDATATSLCTSYVVVHINPDESSAPQGGSIVKGMAQKVITIFVDDLTGEQSEDISTHTLLVDGAGVEIDLTDENYEKLLEILNPYFHAAGARRVRNGASSRGRARRAVSRDGDDSSVIRAWARENGYEVRDRGRVPASVREAHAKAT
jgi:hypothetical protein